MMTIKEKAQNVSENKRCWKSGDKNNSISNRTKIGIKVEIHTEKMKRSLNERHK